MSSNMFSAGVHTYEEEGIKKAFLLVKETGNCAIVNLNEESHCQP